MAESTSEWIIEAEGLTKFFGNRPALREVSFRLKEGQSLGIFGPNGAGKSTLLKILSTLTRPSAGTVRVGGFDLSDDSAEVRRQIGLVSHQSLLYEELTAEENLRFFGKMYDVLDLASRIREVLDAVGLLQRRHDRVRTYSRGMKQRLTIARSVLHDPSLLLLDEPDTGLDQQAGGILEELLSNIGTRGRTVVMVTHNLERGFVMSEQMMFLRNGALVYHTEKGNLSFGDFEQIYSQYAIGN